MHLRLVILFSAFFVLVLGMFISLVMELVTYTESLLVVLGKMESSSQLLTTDASNALALVVLGLGQIHILVYGVGHAGFGHTSRWFSPPILGSTFLPPSENGGISAAAYNTSVAQDRWLIY